MEKEMFYDKEPLVILQGERTKCLSYFHPYCASGTWSGSIRLYNLNAEGNKLAKYLRVTEKPIRGIAFHPSGKYLFVGDDNCCLYIFSIESRGNETCDLVLKCKIDKFHGDYIRCLKFHPMEPNCLFSTGDDKYFSCYDFSEMLDEIEKKKGEEVEMRPKLLFKKAFGHYSMCCDIHPKTPLISSAVSLDCQVVEIRRNNDDECEKDVKFHKKGVNCVKYLRDGEFLASGSDDQTIIIMRRKEEEEGIVVHQVIKDVHHANISCVEERGDLLISGGEDCLLVFHHWKADGEGKYEVRKVVDMKKILETDDDKKARVWAILSFLDFVVVGTDIGLVVFKDED